MPLVTPTPACPTCGHHKRPYRTLATRSRHQAAFRFRGHLRLAASADRQARIDALVVEHQDLVESIAAKIGRRLPPHIQRGELVAVGAIGLIQAAEAFAPTAGYPFRRFASSRVFGAIMDDLRSRSLLKRRGLEKARRGEVHVFEHPILGEREEDHAGRTGADFGVVLPPVAPTQLVALLAKEQLDALFDRIPARDARLIRALYLDGESEEAIAARCGGTVGDVRRRADRVLAALRELASRG